MLPPWLVGNSSDGGAVDGWNASIQDLGLAVPWVFGLPGDTWGLCFFFLVDTSNNIEHHWVGGRFFLDVDLQKIMLLNSGT